MKKKRLLKLADHLEKLSVLHIYDDKGDGFNIGTWGEKNSCGTVACIAGWASLLFDKRVLDDNDGRAVSRGAKILGLSEVVAEKLFVPDDNKLCYRKNEPKRAAWALRRLASGKKLPDNWWKMSKKKICELDEKELA